MFTFNKGWVCGGGRFNVLLLWLAMKPPGWGVSVFLWALCKPRQTKQVKKFFNSIYFWWAIMKNEKHFLTTMGLEEHSWIDCMAELQHLFFPVKSSQGERMKWISEKMWCFRAIQSLHAVWRRSRWERLINENMIWISFLKHATIFICLTYTFVWWSS